MSFPYKFDLIMPYSPRMACGALSSGIQAAVAYDQMDLQARENKINRQFQSAEAEKERMFAREQMDYNSAPAQVARLAAAGINAATQMSGSSGAAGSASGISPGAIPAGSSGISTALPGAFNPIQDMQSLAEAYKFFEEGSVVKGVADADIAQKFASAGLQEMQTKAQEISNKIASKLGMQKKEAEIANLISSKDLLIAQKFTELSKKNLTDAEYENELERSVGIIYDNLGKEFAARFGKNKWKQSEIDLEFHRASIIQDLRTRHAQEIESQAKAKESSAHADEYDASRQEILENVKFKKFDNVLRQTHSKEIAENYCKKLLSDGALSEKEYKEAVQKIRAIKFGQDGENVDRDINDFLHWLKDVVSIFN